MRMGEWGCAMSGRFANAVGTCVMVLLGLIAPACCEGGVSWKPRIVVLTDIAPAEVEPDDLQSLVRLLAYADRLEIEALIFSTGWNTSGGHSNWIEFIYQAIDAYERDLPHLQRRSEQTEFLTDESRQPLGYWPTPRYLRSVTMPGSQKRGMEHVWPDNDSPGSAWILRLADEQDERPIWVLAWGGGNTLAQALWRARQERSPEAFDRLLRKLRFYAITDQDRSYTKGTPYDVSSHSWMRREFEGRLKVIWDECAWLLHNGTGRQRWDEYAARIQGHGHRLGVSLTTGSLVRGRGVVVEATGEAVGLALEPGGAVAVVIELGPVFGNTLRDGCGLLDVNEFPDSRDFNAISAALNRRVEERVLPGLRARAAPGTVVEFAGCVDITDPVRDTAPLRVVPFKVTFP